MRYFLAFTALLVGVACINVAGPRQLVLRYRITALGCDTPCIRPTRTPVDTAARGDTVWIEHVIQLVGTLDTTIEGTVRPDCTENVAIEFGDSTVATLPALETCPDSTAPQEFSTSFPVTRLTRWPVDTGLTPGGHVILGRIMVEPGLEPRLAFTVR
jgi:hypothetical protein